MFTLFPLFRLREAKAHWLLKKPQPNSVFTVEGEKRGSRPEPMTCRADPRCTTSLQATQKPLFPRRWAGGLQAKRGISRSPWIFPGAHFLELLNQFRPNTRQAESLVAEAVWRAYRSLDGRVKDKWLWIARRRSSRVFARQVKRNLKK